MNAKEKQTVRALLREAKRLDKWIFEQAERTSSQSGVAAMFWKRGYAQGIRFAVHCIHQKPLIIKKHRGQKCQALKPK